MSTPSHMKRFLEVHPNIFPASCNRLHPKLTNLKSYVLPALGAVFKSCKYFTKKTYSTRNIDSQMLLGIQYFATNPSRRLATHIWGIRKTNLASCAIHQPSHFNCFNLCSQQNDTQHRIFHVVRTWRYSNFLEYHNILLCHDISFTFLCGQLDCIDAPSPEGRSTSLGEDDVERIVLIA